MNILEDELKSLDPSNSYFNLVGFNPNYGEKVTHQERMKSTNKAKTEKEIVAWLNKVDKIIGSDNILLVQPKIDGLAISVSYHQGNLQKVATRGDGNVGQDVTFLQEYLNFPEKILDGRDIEIRGEVFIPKNSKIPNPDNKPLRNIASGIVNSKSDVSDAKYLDYRMFQVKGVELQTEEHGFAFLRESGFKSVQDQTILCNFNINELSICYNSYIEEARDLYPFETDGLVITLTSYSKRKKVNDNYETEKANAYEVAWKPFSEKDITFLIDVEWSVNKNYTITPTAVFEEVTIGGSNITRASLYNHKNVMEMHLFKGCSIEVEKANDIIPKITKNLDYAKVTKTSKEFNPKECPVCKSETVISEIDDVNIACSNKHCSEVKFKKLLHYVEVAEMKNVAESTLRLLFNKKLALDPIDLYGLEEGDLIDFDGFGEKKIKNLLDEIKRTSTMSIHEFVKRLGIHLVGLRAVKSLDINGIEDFWKFKDMTYVKGQNLIAYRDENKGFIEGLISLLDIKDVVEQEDGLRVAVTGKYEIGRKELQSVLESKGYIFDKSVVKDTNILLCEDSNGTSSKLEKARKNGTKIMSYIDFFEEN